MRNEYRLFDFKDRLPLTFSLIQFDSIFSHMHSYAEIVIVLDGGFQVSIGKDTFYAKEDDIFIINSKTLHSAIADTKATVLSLFINQKGFGLSDEEINSIVFNLNSMRDGLTGKIKEIRYLVYSIIKYNSIENVDSIYTNRAIAFSLFAQLVNNFSVDVTQGKKQDTTMDFYNEISSYINDHYKEGLTLSGLADRFQYSLAYLSRLFRKAFSMTFLEYYTMVRINYSLDDLVSSSKTLDEIAAENGFEDTRSYARAFKQLHNGVLPSQYRKAHRDKRSTFDVESISKKYLNIILRKYDEYLVESKHVPQTLALKKEAIDIKADDPCESISPLQTKILDVGSCKILVYSELRDRVTSLQNHVGFEYLTLKDLFNQTLRLFIKMEDGSYLLSESIFDSLLSYAKRNYLKPYFRFEYDFSMGKDRYLFFVRSILEYLLSHMDVQDCKGWMFSFTYTGLLKDISVKERDEFFSSVLECQRLFSKSLPSSYLVSPSFAREDLHSEAFKAFDVFCMKNRMRFDCFSFGYLPKDGKFLEENKHGLNEFVKSLPSGCFFSPGDVIVEDFGFTGQVSLLNDTIFASSFLAQSLIDNVMSLKAIVKDCAFDPYGYEVQKNPFVGKGGLVTYDGIKKASYNVYLFFSRLGDRLLKRGKNFIATVKGNKIVLLLNNFVMYEGNADSQDFDGDRYQVFKASRNREFHFDIENLKVDEVRIKTSSISRSGGSSYDASLKIGAFRDMKREEIEALRELSHIPFTVGRKKVNQGLVSLDFVVEPLEVKLVEIECLDRMILVR